MGSTRSIRRYKALSRALLSITDWDKDRRVSFITLTASPRYFQSTEHFNYAFRRVFRYFTKILERKGVSGAYSYEYHQSGYLHVHIIAANMPYISKMSLVQLWYQSWLDMGYIIPLPSVDIQAVIYWDGKRFRGRTDIDIALRSVVSYVVKYVSKNARLRGFGFFTRLTYIYRLFSQNLLGRYFENVSYFVRDKFIVVLTTRPVTKTVLDNVRAELKPLSQRYENLVKSFNKPWDSLSTVQQKFMKKLSLHLSRIWYLKLSAGNEAVMKKYSLAFLTPLGYLYHSYARSIVHAVSMLLSQPAFRYYFHGDIERLVSAHLPSWYPVWFHVLHYAVKLFYDAYGDIEIDSLDVDTDSVQLEIKKHDGIRVARYSYDYLVVTQSLADYLLTRA